MKNNVTSITEEYWVCACVKRFTSGKIKAIKSNHPSLKKCKVCGCTPIPDKPEEP